MDHVPEWAKDRLRFRAAGVDFPDLLVVAGTYQLLPPLPFSPGKEVAGVVSAVGDGVIAPRVEERVLARLRAGGLMGRMVLTV